MKTLKIKSNLKNNTLEIANSKNLIGKEVEITIKEVEKSKIKKNRKHSGSVDLKGKADKINLRDLVMNKVLIDTNIFIYDISKILCFIKVFQIYLMLKDSFK